jgi:diguanylate cyclase (GGDEF)-like protein
MTRFERSASTILIIDDTNTNLKIAVEHLQAYHYEVLTARTGEAGLERARLAQPDLILLDVQMPGIDGFETCRRLKADLRTRDIPVIFMTVLTTVEGKLKGFAAGGVDYVLKPFQAEELLARVNTHLTIYKLQRELQSEVRERKQAEAALRKANLELQRLAVLDGLTQIANRRRFDQYLCMQWAQAQQTMLSLLLCDIDHFKQYNDGYGHQAGDRCLQLVADAISRAARHVKDLAARYGGEEFAVILPDTDIRGALRVAEAIQTEIRSLAIPHAYSHTSESVTLSIGVANTVPTPDEGPEALIAATDAALYHAKNQGRNRILWLARGTASRATPDARPEVGRKSEVSTALFGVVARRANCSDFPIVGRGRM